MGEGSIRENSTEDLTVTQAEDVGAWTRSSDGEGESGWVLDMFEHNLRYFLRGWK
jgi:hypothetical protein